MILNILSTIAVIALCVFISTRYTLLKSEQCVLKGCRRRGNTLTHEVRGYSNSGNTVVLARIKKKTCERHAEHIDRMMQMELLGGRDKWKQWVDHGDE